MDRPTASDCQPELTRWSQVWRFALMLAVSALGWGPVVTRQSPVLRLADIGLGVASYVVVVLFRRRWPVAVALVLNLTAAVSGLASGPAVLAVVSVATRRRWREIVPVGLVGYACAVFFAITQPSGGNGSWWLDLTINAVTLGAMISWGLYVGSRRELIWTLQQRAERAEAERDLRGAQARSTERARIAREMHDVLAHRISQISLHAGALAFREDLSADQMRASAAVIQEKAHEALTDLRGVLGVLRDGDGEPMDAPQPTYADVGELVEEARRSGLHVSFRDEVDGAERVPDAVGRTVFRIVQEGITNARKHAPGTLLSIALTGSPETGVDVTLRNPLGFASRTPGAGLGLVGLSERAELRGGRLEHHRDGASFVLHGWIPWAA